MDQNSSVKTAGLSSPPRKSADGVSSKPRERHPSTLKLPRVLETGTEQSNATGSGDLGSSQQEGREPKTRNDGEKSEAGSEAEDERIEELEREIGKMRDSAESQAKCIRETEGELKRTEEELKRTEEILAAGSAELSGKQTFLSTKDRLSEAEVLDIVRDLNQNIYQVAVKLTEEWEKLEQSRATSQKDANSNPRYSRPVPALVRLVRNKDSGSLTFLIQSRLCYQASYITSSWKRQQGLDTLQSVYERLSASGEGCIVDVKQYVTHIS